MPGLDQEPTGNLDGIDADKLESEAFASEGAREITSVPASETPPAPVKEEAPTEFTLNVGGEQIKIPFNDPRVSQWLQQGRNYSQHMEKFNIDRSQFEERSKWAEGIEKTYKPVDDWAKANPDKWQAFQQRWQQEQYAQTQAQPADQPWMSPIQQLQGQIGQISQFIQGQQAEKQEHLNRQARERLDQDFESLRKSYPKIDFNAPDSTGKSLEYQILNHAKANGLSSVKTAFRDFYHDQLMNQAKTEGKESVSQEIQKRSRLGLLGESPAPKRGLTEIQDVKSKSYDQIHQEILSELGIA